MLLMTYVVRVAIASVLLFGGILWLARTTSIEELMLNAVALNSILDVDEFLFAGMAPIKIQSAIRNLKPISVSYSRCRSQLESFVHFQCTADSHPFILFFAAGTLERCHAGRQD